MSVAELWRGVTHCGVPAEMPPTEARYVVLTNTVVAMAVLATLCYVPLNLTSAGLPLHIRLSAPILGGLFLVTLWLNARGWHGLAAIWLFATALESQIYFSSAFGAASGNELFFVPLMSAVWLLFPPSRERIATALAAITLGIFVVLVYWLPAREPFVARSEEQLRQYLLFSMVLVALLTGAIGYYSRRTTLQAEAALGQRNEELSRALEQIRDAQLQLVETEKQAVVGRLVAGIVHELNTPLGTLRSAGDTVERSLQRCEAFLDGAREERDEARTRSALGAGRTVATALTQSAERISRTVDTLKHFVSLDAAERKPHDVREGLDTALSLLAEPYGARTRVVRDYADEVSRVLCYPAKLNQVFLSVLQNAGQAIDGDGEVRVRVAPGEGERVEVEITDDGRGIAADRLAGIFEVGFTDKGGRVGMRLGLAMSKRHVEEIGGRIEVRSELGRGTAVLLSLPVG